ncbi:hypothetical protein [Pontibacter anaerobius]|uniref:DinB family protein n=1 Tax=Pontibacter anaerobius TaxID=2993940 RepID=A0ABT3RB34_9BACT|nr:hypothetical protein [Pontibacter anaerobius]MCX2738736.1 hypothetical protein [Pontibacter anaerobius]
MMKQNQFEALFSGSFDTFKVFYNLTPQETGCNVPTSPKKIWQILHHLIVWQDYQLIQLQGTGGEVEINEQLSWSEEEQCDSQEKLDKTVSKFYNQLECIREEISLFNLQDPDLQKKLKIAQNLSVHLSFHIGEIILMRRMTGSYPLHQMQEFLN